MVGVGFRWALFDGGQARHRAAALRRSSDAVRQRRNELESLVRLEVRQSQLGIEAADARVILTREAIAEANENLRITREQYAENLVTNTQVLEAIALQTAAEGKQPMPLSMLRLRACACSKRSESCRSDDVVRISLDVAGEGLL